MAKHETSGAPSPRAGEGREGSARCRRPGRGGTGARAELDALRSRLAKVEGEHRKLTSHFVLLEQQVTRLTFLYTAARQLLDSLDRDALVSTVSETVVNIVGSEDFALYERDPARGAWDLVAAVGEGAARAGRPREGVGPLGALLAQGEPRYAPARGIAAFVPLRHQDELAGALVVFQLLPHKAGLEQVDRDLLALYGSHAARALLASRAGGGRP